MIDQDNNGFIDVEELKDHYTLPDGKFNFSALNQLISAFETIQHRENVSHVHEVTITFFLKKKKKKKKFFFFFFISSKAVKSKIGGITLRNPYENHTKKKR